MQRMRTPEEMKMPQWELDKMDRDEFDPNLSSKRRIEKLEAALRAALYYVERVGDDGEGGTSDHAVTLNAIREALKDRPEIIQPASDKKVPWPSNLDPTAWK